MTPDTPDTGAGTPPRDALLAECEASCTSSCPVGACEHHGDLDPTLDAARPATDPAGLDVERLAHAMANEVDSAGEDERRQSGDLWSLLSERSRKEWRTKARRVEDEYARLAVADGPGPEERPDLEAAAQRALDWFGLTAGAYFNKYGDNDDPVDVLLAALPVHREELGHGTPVPEEADLPSGDARIEGLGHREEPRRFCGSCGTPDHYAGDRTHPCRPPLSRRGQG